MRKCKITVWDHEDNVHGHGHTPKDHKPAKYEVEAWCVNGDEGIKAFFFLDDTICMADGDDGHWWLVDRFHMHWIHDIEKAVHAIAEEEIKLAKTKRIKRIDKSKRKI